MYKEYAIHRQTETAVNLIHSNIILVGKLMTLHFYIS